MADFLGRLAERALGSALTAQPMITAMFAPGQAMVVDGSPGFASESEAESDAGEQTTAFTSPTRPTSSQPPRLPPTLVTRGNLPVGGARPAVKNMAEAPRQRVLSDTTGQVELPASPRSATFTASSQGPTRSVYATSSQVQPLKGQGAGTQSTQVLGALPQQVKGRGARSSSVQGHGIDMQSAEAWEGQVDVPIPRAGRGIPSSMQPGIPAEVWKGQADVPIARGGRDISSSIQPGVAKVWSPVVRSSQGLAPRRGNSNPQADTHFESTEQIVVSQREEAPGPTSSPSTISVTIGRIEVRATPALPARAQSQRQASPVMSLDQYLHQRAKGGGR